MLSQLFSNGGQTILSSQRCHHTQQCVCERDSYMCRRASVKEGINLRMGKMTANLITMYIRTNNGSYKYGVTISPGLKGIPLKRKRKRCVCGN